MKFWLQARVKWVLLQIKTLVIKVYNYCHETNLIKMVVRYVRWVVFCWSATAHCPFSSHLRFLCVCESSRGCLHRHMAWITVAERFLFSSTHTNTQFVEHIKLYIQWSRNRGLDRTPWFYFVSSSQFCCRYSWRTTEPAMSVVVSIDSIDHRRCPAYLDRQVALTLVFIENAEMSQSDWFHSIN